MSGHYGMIIDRKSDYSIVPIDVYEVLNGLEKLKAIAVVVRNEQNFLSIKQAHERIVKVVNTKI